MTELREAILRVIHSHAQVDAIYLYGSRAKQTAHANSDWDIAVLFSAYERDALARALRPQALQAELERELKLYNRISVVDLEAAPVYLQYSILMSAVNWFDRNVPHVRRVFCQPGKRIISNSHFGRLTLFWALEAAYQSFAA